MGQILPGVVVAFENPKGGVGKSTLTALFAGYIHSQSNEEGGLSIAVVDIVSDGNLHGIWGGCKGIHRKPDDYENKEFVAGYGRCLRQFLSGGRLHGHRAHGC